MNSTDLYAICRGHDSALHPVITADFFKMPNAAFVGRWGQENKRLLPKRKPSTITAAGLRQAIAELKKSDSDNTDAGTPWERSQRKNELREIAAEHESNHAVVALDLGASISEIVIANDGGGFVSFDYVPPKHRIAISLAGSFAESRGLGSPGCEADAAKIDAVITGRFPGATPYERGAASDLILEDAERSIQLILFHRWEFRRALIDHLLVEGRMGGPAAHRLWDDIYPGER